MPTDDLAVPADVPPPVTTGNGPTRSARVLVTVVLVIVAAGCASSSEPSGEPTDGAPVPAATASAPTGGADLVSRGEELFQAQNCANCHAVDGTTRVGPSLAGIWGDEVALEDGSTVTVDAAYVAESLRDPNAKVVEGFGSVMPAYEGLSDEDVAALTAYIESLGAGD